MSASELVAIAISRRGARKRPGRRMKVDFGEAVGQAPIRPRRRSPVIGPDQAARTYDRRRAARRRESAGAATARTTRASHAGVQGVAARSAQHCAARAARARRAGRSDAPISAISRADDRMEVEMLMRVEVIEGEAGGPEGLELGAISAAS